MSSQVDDMITSHIEHEMEAENDYIAASIVLVARRLGWKVATIDESVLCKILEGDHAVAVPFSSIEEMCDTYQDVEKCLVDSEQFVRESLMQENE
jgi:hypothetical protein